jgi:hypothetical protein
VLGWRISCCFLGRRLRSSGLIFAGLFHRSKGTKIQKQSTRPPLVSAFGDCVSQRSVAVVKYLKKRKDLIWLTISVHGHLTLLLWACSKARNTWHLRNKGWGPNILFKGTPPMP